VSLTELAVQLHIHATNCMAKCVHPNIVVKIKNRSFSLLVWHGLFLYEAGAVHHTRLAQCTINKAHK